MAKRIEYTVALKVGDKHVYFVYKNWSDVETLVSSMMDGRKFLEVTFIREEVDA